MAVSPEGLQEPVGISIEMRAPGVLHILDFDKAKNIKIQKNPLPDGSLSITMEFDVLPNNQKKYGTDTETRNI